MGICLPCLGGQADDYDQPSPNNNIKVCKEKWMLVKACPLLQRTQETRRRQLAEAAEKRKREDEGRGVKDPEALKRKQQKREEIEKKAEQSGGGEAGLRWQVS